MLDNDEGRLPHHMRVKTGILPMAFPAYEQKMVQNTPLTELPATIACTIPSEQHFLDGQISEWTYCWGYYPGGKHSYR